jgi:seryl-tRNA synthetase
MLDLNQLRENYQKIAKRIRDRQRKYEQLDEFLVVDKE